MKGKDGTIWSRQELNNSEYQSTSYFEPVLGPSVNSLTTINEFFDFFIDEFIIQSIVDCTNKRLTIETKKITAIELKGYIGLLLLFGATKKHDIEIDEIYKFGSVNHMDWATVCMPRDRFHLISSNITFDDFETRNIRYNSNPKLHKISGVFNRLKDNLLKG